MSGEIQVSLRINGDGSGLTAVLRTAQGEVKNFGEAAKTASAQATAALNNVAASGKTAAAGISAVTAATQQATGTISGATAATNGLQFATAGVTRELAVMVGEALRGNYNRLIGSTTVLANRTGILASLINPLGIAIGLTAGAMAVLVYKSLQAEQGLVKFNNAVEISGTGSGRTTGQLADLAVSLERMGIKSKEADAAVIGLATSGKFVGTTLEVVAQEAAIFADLTGEKIGAAVKEFEKLADNPVKALIELDRRTHAVDESTVALVASLQAQGNEFAASSIAALALAPPLEKAKKAADEFAATHGFWENFKLDTAAAAEAEAGLADNLLVERAAADKAREAQERLTQARAIIGNQIQNATNSIIEALTKEKAKLDEITATYGKGKVGLAEYTIAKAEAAIKSIALAAAEQTFFEELKNGVGVFQAGRDAYNAYSAAVDHAHDVLGNLEKSLISSAKAADASIAIHKHAAETATDAYIHMDEVINSIAQKSDDALTKAHDQAAQSAHRLEVAFIAEEKAGVPLAARLAQLQLGIKLVGDQFEAATAKIKTSDTVLAELNKKLDEDVRLAGMSADAKELERQKEAALNEAIKNHIDLTPQFLAAMNATVEAHYRDKQAAEADRTALKEWQQIATSGFDSLATTLGDFVTGGIKNWHDFGQALVTDTKQFIAQVIAEFLKLLVFNGIINSLFGTALPTGLGSLNLIGSLGSAAGTAGAAGGAAAGQAGIAAGQSAGSLFDLLGKEVPGTGGMEFGTLLQGAGAVLAGFSAYKAAGGGAGGIAAGAAYGVGTYVLGGVGTAVAGGVAAAGVSGGIAAGSAALGAIPVVGWVALAAMAINMISGGKLFGTSYKPTGQTSTGVNVGDGSVTITDSYQESKQKALFGGKKYKDVNVAPSQQQNDFAEQLKASLLSTRQAAADALGSTLAGAVQGSFKQVTDKSGKITSEISTVLGKTYQEPIDKFIERIEADNVIAQINAALGSDEASKIADRYQSNADTLAAAAQMLLAAEVDVKHGMSLLGSDTSLTDIATEVQKLNVDGESLLQTYARLQTETQTFDGILTSLGVKTNVTGAAFVELTDDLVKSAGSLQNLADEWNAYYQAYYSDSERAANSFTALKKATTDALTGIGLDANTTMSQFRTAFEAYLASSPTADGIQKWLLAAGYLSSYTQAVADNATVVSDALKKYQEATKAYTDFSRSLAVQAGTITAYEDSIYKINQAEQDQIDQANALAQAAGLQGASEMDLANIHKIAANAAAQALADLQQSTADLLSQLGLTTDTTAVANSAANAFNSVANSANDAAQAAKDLYDAQLAAIKQVRDFLATLIQNTALTTLTPQQRLEAAQAQYEATLTGAKAGNKDDLANLSKYAQSYLEAARQFYGSNDQYTTIFDAVRGGLTAFTQQQLTNPGGGTTGGGSSGDYSAPVVTAVNNNALATQLNLQKLIGNLRDLMAAENIPFSDLVKQLNLNVPKLLTELGIDITKDTVDTTLQLATLAGQLGISLQSVADQVGFKIGDLRDANSLDTQALLKTLQGLPQDDADKISGYLKAIEQATTDADANSALQTLTDYVNTLPEGERSKLAPYLDGIVSNTTKVVLQSDPLGQLALGTFTYANMTATATGYMRQDISSMLDVLNSGTIRVAVVSGSAATASNTTTVTALSSTASTSLALSAISASNESKRAQIDSNAAVVTELRKVREELAALRKERAGDDSRALSKLDVVADTIASAGKDQARAIDRQTDAIKGRR